MTRYNRQLRAAQAVYDNASEDDEQIAADARARRMDEQERAYEASLEPPWPSRPMRVYADAVWCPVRKCAVPDTVGVLVYPEDFA